MVTFTNDIRFLSDTRPKGSWPAGLIVFHCVTPMATRESRDALVAWCEAEFGPRGGTWGYSDPWMTFTDAYQAVVFRMRWT